jgi:hypothetical protein
VSLCSTNYLPATPWAHLKWDVPRVGDKVSRQVCLYRELHRNERSLNLLLVLSPAGIRLNVSEYNIFIHDVESQNGVNGRSYCAIAFRPSYCGISNFW